VVTEALDEQFGDLVCHARADHHAVGVVGVAQRGLDPVFVNRLLASPPLTPPASPRWLRRASR
jgi:hypothetical protein